MSNLIRVFIDYFGKIDYNGRQVQNRVTGERIGGI